MTEDFISELTKKDQITADNYKMVEKIVSELQGDLVHYQEMAAQKSGNCTYASMKTTVFVLMATRIILNQIEKGELSLDQVDASHWQNAFEAAKPDYKKWSLYDRELVTEDFLVEAEEWLSGETSFCQNDFKETYTLALTSFVAAQNEGPISKKKEEHLAKAQAILEKLG